MSKKRIVILGAGISGLSLGWFLHQKFGDTIDLKIIEKSPRVGGWIQTIQKNGFLFELGPHSCRSQSHNFSTLKLAQQLQIHDQIIFADPAANERYLLHKQSLKKLPTSTLEFLYSPLMSGVLKACLQESFKSKSIHDDESIYEFISRRFNSHIAENLIDPLVSGIYAGDMRKLSMRSCFPQLYEDEQKHGSLVWAMLKRKKSNTDIPKGIFSFKEGMETLPKELAKRLDQFLTTSCEVMQLKISKTDTLKLKLSDGEVLETDYLFSTISPKALAQILTDEYSYLIRALNQLMNTSVCILNLGYEDQVLKNKGFGYLVPSIENEEILGVIWDSAVFPQQNKKENETRLTVMMGGAKNMDLCDLNCKEQLEIALDAIKRHLGIIVPPQAVHVTVAQEAIPQYAVGHLAAVREIKNCLAKLSSKIAVIGSAFEGVSLNDCIVQSEKMAEISLS